MKRFRTVPLLMLLLAASCGKEKDGPTTGPSDPSGIRIPVSQVPLYADLTDYKIYQDGTVPSTRSSEEETVSLEELLDTRKVRTKTSGEYTVTQTAFKQNEENIYTLTYSAEHDADQDVPTRVKKFLISAESAKGERYGFVAVLVTSAEYAEANRSFDFFEKPNYTGNVLFCTPEGELMQNCEYTDGRVVATRMLTPEESASYDGGDMRRIYLLEPSNTTRVYGGQLQTSYCIDFAPLKPKPTGGGGGGTGNDDDDKRPDGNNGSAPPGTTQDRDWDNFGVGILLPNIPPVVSQFYDVKLTTNDENITMSPNGSFEENTVIFVDYEVSFDILKADFSHWTGTFRMKNSAQFSYKVTEHVDATAYFNVTKAPCHNAETNLTNPLKDMRIAPTATGDYLKGIYHAVIRRYDKKTGEPIYHWGLDLAAEPGTPVYATTSGRIVKLKKGCPKGKLGNDYNGGYGNEIIVACDGYIKPYNDDGKFSSINIVYVQYAHLQHGNAIAYNYKEGRIFQEGDDVQAGEIIGYTGNSGNAWDVPHPHLHYGISFDGDENGNIVRHSWVDPADFINGEIDMEQLADETRNKVENGGKVKTTDCY